MYHNSKTNLPVQESDKKQGFSILLLKLLNYLLKKSLCVMKRFIQPDYRNILIIIVWILLKGESLLDCTHSLL